MLQTYSDNPARADELFSKLSELKKNRGYVITTKAFNDLRRLADWFWLYKDIELIFFKPNQIKIYEVRAER